MTKLMFQVKAYPLPLNRADIGTVIAETKHLAHAAMIAQYHSTASSSRTAVISTADEFVYQTFVRGEEIFS